MTFYAVYETPAGETTRFVGHLEAEDLADAIYLGKRCGSVPLDDNFSLDFMLTEGTYLTEADASGAYCAIEISDRVFRCWTDYDRNIVVAPDCYHLGNTVITQEVALHEQVRWWLEWGKRQFEAECQAAEAVSDGLLAAADRHHALEDDFEADVQHLENLVRGCGVNAV